LLVTADDLSLCQGFDNTEPEASKAAVAHFIERIELKGPEVKTTSSFDHNWNVSILMATPGGFFSTVTGW